MPTLTAFDRTDLVLLNALQNNARLSNKSLAALANLAPSSCLARVKKLEAVGAIKQYRAELDPRSLGLGLQALIGVQLRLHVGKDFGSIGDHFRSLPEAVAVYCLGGATDFLVHVMCHDTEHLRRLTIESFTSRQEVGRIETSLVFSFARLSLPVAVPARVVLPTETKRLKPARPRRGG
jgi:DNA-binding Lrp family transcriptional regulator